MTIMPRVRWKCGFGCDPWKLQVNFMGFICKYWYYDYDACSWILSDKADPTVAPCFMSLCKVIWLLAGNSFLRKHDMRMVSIAYLTLKQENE